MEHQATTKSNIFKFYTGNCSWYNVKWIIKQDVKLCTALFHYCYTHTNTEDLKEVHQNVNGNTPKC